jgi:hypothetical protein
VNDVHKVDAYFTSLGFQPFSRIDHNVSLDRVYRGQPGSYEMWLGWDRTGDFLPVGAADYRSQYLRGWEGTRRGLPSSRCECYRHGRSYPADDWAWGPAIPTGGLEHTKARAARSIWTPNRMAG